MPVFYQGKTMERCPRGHTHCRDVLGEKAMNCITVATCDAKRKERGETRGRKKKEGREGGEAELEKRTKEKTEETLKEYVNEIEEFFKKLRQGLIIDPKTGRVIESIDKNDPGAMLKALKRLGKLYTSEVLDMVPGMSNLNDFITILSSSGVSGRLDVATGVMEKYMGDLGLDIEFERDDQER